MSHVARSSSKRHFPPELVVQDRVIVHKTYEEGPQASNFERTSGGQPVSTRHRQSDKVDRTSITRFILCCDGTKNDGVNKRRPRTNVARLARCISNTGRVPQVVFYMRGVGTGTSRVNNWRDSFNGRGAWLYKL